jgi:signal transduction histidine kinase
MSACAVNEEVGLLECRLDNSSLEVHRLQFDTLTFYLVASGLSLSLALVLVGFQAMRPQAVSARQCALAILLLAAGFFGAGFGQALPRWATVIGTNMVLMTAGVVMHRAFLALIEKDPLYFDKLGWGTVALSTLPFWYWGLVEPNGHYRSVVFSLAVLVINGRTALSLTQAARKQRSVPLAFLALLLLTLCAWMLGRAILLVVTEAPADARSANPTTWVTVFWFVVLISLITMATLWLETNRLRERAEWPGQVDLPERSGIGLLGFSDNLRGKLILLWSTVLVVSLGAAAEIGVSYAHTYDIEKQRLVEATKLSNDAFTEHSNQVVGQVDAMLNAVRGFYIHTRSLTETEGFINGLHFNRSVIDNIYLISATGQIVISHDANAVGRSVADLGYFRYHLTHTSDNVFISPVEKGRVTGKYLFRISRRINLPDGQFGGLVFAAVNPEAFARYYQQLTSGKDALASLVSTEDRMLRARVPEPMSDAWQMPIESPAWQALANAPSGVYENISQVDGIKRIFAFKKVGDTPLVMVTGLSYADLRLSVLERLLWLGAGALAIVAFLMVLAVLLTLEIRHRNEQDRFLSMLSHELKTPLSVIQMTLSSVAVPAPSKSRLQRAISDVVSIVDRSLQADRLQRRQVRVVATRCQVDKLVAELVSNCSAPDRIVVKVAELPTCKTDAQLLSIVLNNLIDNALKYAAANSQVELAASEASRLARPGIQVDVSNMPGPAGSPDAKQVFKKYYRAASAQGKSGSGLGLYIASGLARVLGGHLSYQPTAGMVRFSVWIPL